MENLDNTLSLEHHIGTDGVLYITVLGKISNDYLEQFSTWADEIKLTIKKRAEEGENPILVLTDIRGVVHFERKPIAVLRELLSYDTQFPIRSAVVGGNRFAVLIFDSIIGILHRTNVRHFKDKQSALAWLFAEKHP